MGVLPIISFREFIHLELSTLHVAFEDGLIEIIQSQRLYHVLPVWVHVSNLNGCFNLKADNFESLYV